MRSRLFFIIISISLLLVFIAGCGPETPAQREKAIQNIYNRTLQRYSTSNPWQYGYNMMIYAAWEHKGRERSSSAAEPMLRDGYTIFNALRAEIATEAANGATTLDRQKFLAIIPDENTRAKVSTFIDEEIPTGHVYARAYMEQLLNSNLDFPLPQEILRQLGKLYMRRPDLLDVPRDGQVSDDEDEKWRDWLIDALAGCGLPGILTAIEFDHQVDGLQKYVPENFWDGRLSIAYNLRSIQLAKAQALEPLMQEMAGYRQGGQVTGFHDWMYYDLGWSIHSKGGLFPYSEEDINRINDFIQKGLEEGPLGDGEEAVTIANAIGRTQSIEEAGRLFGLIDNPNMPCERKSLGYIGLATMFASPVETWVPDATSQEWLRSNAVRIAEMGALPCGNSPLFKFYEGILTGFTREQASHWPGSLFSEDELVRIHEAFIAMLPSFTTADDRASTLYLLRWGLAQPEFMIRHPELSRYRAIFLGICADWPNSTSFEGAKISQEDFNSLVQDFRNSLG